MNTKRLGVLGGMGPAATSLFFDKVITNTIASTDQEHIDIIISNHATLPDRTEAILQGKGHLFLQAVKADFRLFEYANVNHIAIPCNTSHYYLKEMQRLTDIKIINMIEMTVQTIISKFGANSKIAILATDGTIKSKVYENECHKNHIIPHIPKLRTQEKIMKMIYDIKSNKNVEPCELESIIEYELNNEQCTGVILGCTELSCLPLSPVIKEKCIDPLEVLVHASICYVGKKSRLSHLHNSKLNEVVSI